MHLLPILKLIDEATKRPLNWEDETTLLHRCLVSASITSGRRNKSARQEEFKSR